jgi:hypothetical protein
VKRRRFLEATSVGVAAGLWPAWLSEAFADEPACDTGWTMRVAQVAGAFRRAQEAGKRLLVFVVPADDTEKWMRGGAFGELLNFGSDRDLAPLAGVEVACATMADLKKIVPGAGAGEPIMVLVDPSRVPAAARQIDVVLPPYPDLYGEEPMSWEERAKAEDTISDQRIAVMGKTLRDALGSDDRRAPALAALAADVRGRLRDKRVPGSKWARSGGCGTTVEGDSDGIGYACGMGHTPKKSARFLYFFTKRVF